MSMRKNFCRAVSLLTLFSAFFFVWDVRSAHARNSKAWRERLAARTVTLWIEGQPLGDGLVLNARAELNVTWLERGLSQILDSDNDVDEWVVNGLNYYFSNRKEMRDKLKKGDVFVLGYKAIKNWNFNPLKLTVNGHGIKQDDILTRKGYWESELIPGDIGMIVVTAPSLKPGQTVEFRYEDAEARFEVPRTRAK